jgi:hypothetical protein
MYSQEQIASLYEFLLHTGEGNLKKMLVDRNLTEGHLRFLLRVVKTCNCQVFTDHLNNNTFPTMKFNALELSMRERFWNTCCNTFEARGLLNPEQKLAA